VINMAVPAEYPPRIRVLWDPEIKRRVKFRWVGWHKWYSMWESTVTGIIILGEPYKEE